MFIQYSINYPYLNLHSLFKPTLVEKAVLLTALMIEEPNHETHLIKNFCNAFIAKPRRSINIPIRGNHVGVLRMVLA